MAYTAQDVKTLREMTGVGMMDCKKALVETDGNMEAAVDYLREKGLAAAQKKASRVAAEGIAFATVINGVGIAIEVNAETDFVGKNEKFVTFVKTVAQAVAESNPADVEALLDAPYPGTDRTVREQQQEMVLVIGENITVRRFARYTTGLSVPYVHAGGKVGVIVNLEVDGIADMAAVEVLGKDVAMQVAAMNPLYLDETVISEEELVKERAIQLALAIEEGKEKNLPDDKAQEIAEKKVAGRMNKFFAEMCLLNQEFVKGDKITVGKHVAQVAKELGGTIVIKAFTRFEKGEGIEKKQDDFAAEIASLVK